MSIVTRYILFGVAVQGIANVLMLQGEGIVYAVSRHFHIDFGKVKTGRYYDGGFVAIMRE